MEKVEKRILQLTRVPPGDRWTPVDSDEILDTLTDGLNHIYKKTKCTEYVIVAHEGKVYSIKWEEEEPVVELPKRYNIYGEDE